MAKLKAALTDNSIFRRAYIVCLFLCAVSFVQIVAYAALVVLFCWGVFLLIYNETRRHTMFKTRMGAWLLAFVLMTMVTAIIHITDNFFYNIVIELHICICFYIFYAVHTEKDLNFRRELYSVCRFLVYTTTVIGVIGLAFLMAGIQFEVLWVKFIVYENRFTGLYSNPNLMAFDAVAAIFCCHMLTKKDFIKISGKERVSRIWIASCVGVNAISLLLCDSNGGLVLMVAYAFFFLVYKMFGAERRLKLRQILTKGIACLLAGVFLVGATLFVREICQKGITQVMQSTDAVVSQYEREISPDKDMFSATARIATFEHQNKNIDSGRIKLWKQAAQMFREFPIFGVGKGNVYSYGEEMFENGIAFSDLFGSWLANYTTDFHNGYISILVCSGVVGFVFVTIFGLRFAKHITVHVFRRDDLKESILPCMWAFLFAYAVYSLFEKTLLYDVSFTVMFFWMIMGYTSCFLCRYEPEDHTGIVLFRRRLRKSLL